MTADSSSADQLVRVALPMFGAQGVEGVSTRAIAQAAGKPMSAITYHFGGKEGLYLACARHIADTIGALMGGAVNEATEAIGASEARAQLGQLFSQLIIAMNHHETDDFARFIVREQQDPTEAFDILYGGMMGRTLSRMVALMRIVAGAGASDIDLRVRVIALMGQVMAFRVARAATLRLTGWTGIGEPERRTIDRVIQSHLAAILDSIEGEQRA